MSNPLLNFDGLPRFDEIRPEHVTPAIETLLNRCKTVVAGLEAPMTDITWDNFVTPLDDCTEQLSRAWGIVGHLSAVVDTPELRAAYNENIPRITEFWTSLSQNLALFKKYKALRNASSFDSVPSTGDRKYTARFPSGRCRIAGRQKETFCRNPGKNRVSFDSFLGKRSGRHQ